MNILDKIKEKFSPDAKRINQSRQICKKLHNTHVKYATVAVDGEDIIIGKDGHFNITDENIFELTFGITSAFKLEIDKMEIWEFMSLDGAFIKGVDLNDGKEKDFKAYYDKHLT